MVHPGKAIGQAHQHAFAKADDDQAVDRAAHCQHCLIGHAQAQFAKGAARADAQGMGHPRAIAHQEEQRQQHEADQQHAMRDQAQDLFARGEVQLVRLHGQAVDRLGRGQGLLPPGDEMVAIGQVRHEIGHRHALGMGLRQPLRHGHAVVRHGGGDHDQRDDEDKQHEQREHRGQDEPFPARPALRRGHVQRPERHCQDDAPAQRGQEHPQGPQAGQRQQHDGNEAGYPLRPRGVVGTLRGPGSRRVVIMACLHSACLAQHTG